MPIREDGIVQNVNLDHTLGDFEILQDCSCAVIGNLSPCVAVRKEPDFADTNESIPVNSFTDDVEKDKQSAEENSDSEVDNEYIPPDSDSDSGKKKSTG